MSESKWRRGGGVRFPLQPIHCSMICVLIGGGLWVLLTHLNDYPWMTVNLYRVGFLLNCAIEAVVGLIVYLALHSAWVEYFGPPVDDDEEMWHS